MQTDTHRSRHSACGPSDRLHIMCCTSHAAKQIKINLNISVTDFVALTATIAESVKHRSGVRPSVRLSRDGKIHARKTGALHCVLGPLRGNPAGGQRRPTLWSVCQRADTLLLNEIDTVYCYGRCSVVCLSISVSVFCSRSWALQNTWTDTDAVWEQTRVLQTGVRILLRKGAHLGERMPTNCHWKV